MFINMNIVYPSLLHLWNMFSDYRNISSIFYVPTSLQKLYSKCSMFKICAKTRSETNRLFTHGGNIRCACNKQKDVCCLFSDYKLSWRYVYISNLHSLGSNLTGGFLSTFYSISLVKFERKTLEVKEKLTK